MGIKLIIGGVVLFFANLYGSAYILSFAEYSTWWQFPVFATATLLGVFSVFCTCYGIALVLEVD